MPSCGPGRSSPREFLISRRLHPERHRRPCRGLAVFVPFAVVYMRQPLKLDYRWAALCIVGAVYFIFRSPAAP
jgi:hypothetical protein